MSTTTPVHSRLAWLTSTGAELCINGVSLSALAERVGTTPFYAYDRAAISQRVASLRQHLPPMVKLHYAIKANPMPAVVAHILPLVDGFDVASQREMLVALDSGMPAAEISFAGPAKREPELRAAIAAGVCINCESELELERIATLSNTLGRRGRVAIRVNPDFELKGSGMKMSGSPRQFGIDAERVPAALQRAHALDLRLEGLHIFCGSQNLRADAIIEANRNTLALAVALSANSPQAFSFVNIGGGYGIPYFPGEADLDLAAVGEALGATIAQWHARLSGCAVVVELGRYLVGEAGYYVCRVTDTKLSRGQRFVMVDGGLHHHLANSGNFGQILRKNYPVVAGTRVDQAAAETVTVVGPLCTPLDLVAERVALPALAVGDLVVVLQSGAYGYSASPQRFLSHPAAVEILV